jgi:glycosyltransferase involved in cell wall biosynthesis
MKNTFIKILDIFLFLICVVICFCAVVVMLPWLLPKRRVALKFNSSSNRLLLLSEAASYETLKEKGNLFSLTTHLCSGYFEKMYVVHFPTLRSQTVHLTELVDLIEIRSIAKFLKQYKFTLTYTLINSIWYFFNIFLMRRFALENVNIIRGAGVHYTALGALFLQHLTGIPTCISVHSDDEKRYVLMKKYGGFWNLFNLRWLTVQVHRFVFSYASRVLLVRESLKDWAIRRGASIERIRLFPHGIKTEEFFQAYEGDIRAEFNLNAKRLVVFAGRLSQENYVYDIIEIVEMVSKQISDIIFLMIGDGPERQSLESLSNERDLKEYIRFLGFQPQKKVFEFQKHADVNLCLMAGYRLIEAALSKKPIISYDVEWHYELIKNAETGFLIAEHDVKSVANAIITLIHNPKFANELGENAYRLALERHEIGRTDQKKVELYEELKRIARK